MAMGERSECRLGRGTTHAHFASLPVTADGIDEGAALSSLARVLYDEGSAEALFYLYGALRPVAGASGGRPTRDRLEFFLDLTRDEDEIAAGIKRAHRARIRKGTNAGWELRYLNGAGAARALYEVQTRAAERQAERGSGYEVSRIDEDAIAAITDRSKAHGLQVVAGFAGEELLAALLIGWGGGQAYCVKGGSTPAGYRRSGAHWLQWQMVVALKADGFHSYNLGGTPKGADEPNHPQHGLYEYKRTFGTEVRACRGVHFRLRRAHLGLHALAGVFRG